MPQGVRKEKNEEAIAFARTLKHIPWCEDYEKMISGMLYSCLAPELEAGRMRARRLATKFNTYVPREDATMQDMAEDRMSMMKEMFGKVGPDSFMEPNLQVDYGCNISVGERFYANFNTVLLDCALITIGDRVFFGTGVSLITATHETSLQSRRDNVEYAEPITIGDDCWLGSNATILPGVTVGKGCTVGAGALVTKDIPPYCVVMGVPARIVKHVDPID